MLKQTSIRNRLVLSNMLMIFIPVVIIVVVVISSTSLISYFSSSRFSIDPTFGSYLLYRTQFDASNIESKISDASNGKEDLIGKLEKKNAEPLRGGVTKSTTGLEKLITDSVLIECANIQKNGFDILILADDEIVYKTIQADAYNIIDSVFNISGKSLSDIKTSFVSANEAGTVIANVFKLEQGDVIKIVIINNSLSAIVSSEKVNDIESLLRGDNIISIAAITAVVAIVMTNGIMVIFVLRSIMGPLTKLQTATHELRDGNLDYQIDYKSNNEIGQVCADFDEMRLRLKDSVEKQQKYEESRMEMIAGISHDLGTPLTTIKGYASGLMDGIADTEEKRNKYLKTIYNTADDMDRMVSELSVLSKFDFDKVPFYFDKVRARDFFDECSEDVRHSFESSGMEFEYKCDCSEDKYISIDIGQFKRVIGNLVENCKKYRDEAKDVNRAVLSVADIDEGIELIFEDNGVGVHDGEYEKIFDTFYRSDKARSNAKKGSGLGLAITKRIVEGHDATIEASRSSLGGLAIKITIPNTHDTKSRG